MSITSTTKPIQTNDPIANLETKKIIDQIISQNKERPGAPMVVLNEIQSTIGFISESMQEYIAEKLQVPISRIHGVVSFYSFFTTEPRGKHVVKFCIGTACYVGGASQLIDKAKQVLGIEPGQTTPDGLITLEVCRCVGACSQAPVVVVDEVNNGHMKPTKFTKIIEKVLSDEAAA